MGWNLGIKKEFPAKLLSNECGKLMFLSGVNLHGLPRHDDVLFLMRILKQVTKGKQSRFVDGTKPRL